MSDHGTISNEFPGWYVQFQADILLQLPRPGEISEDVALGWHDNRGAMKKALCEMFVPSTSSTVKPAPQPLLIPVGTVNIVATITPFVAKDRFVPSTKKDAAVKISYLGDTFQAWFLGQTEEPFTGSTLRYDKLSRNSVNDPIIAALGGEEKAETTLTELFSLMKAQKNSENGSLLTNGYANIFYVRDVSGVLRAVNARWHGGGWRVLAGPVTYPNPWYDGDQFFSRDSR